MCELVLAHFMVLFYFVFNFTGSTILQDKRQYSPQEFSAFWNIENLH